MQDHTRTFIARSARIRSALLVFCALMLFLAGVLLLLAPASAQNDESRLQTVPFPCAGNGWIIGAQSHEPGFVGGG